MANPVIHGRYSETAAKLSMDYKCNNTVIHGWYSATAAKLSMDYECLNPKRDFLDVTLCTESSTVGYPDDSKFKHDEQYIGIMTARSIHGWYSATQVECKGEGAAIYLNPYGDEVMITNLNNSSTVGYRNDKCKDAEYVGIVCKFLKQKS